jgi:hypothetical protein
MRLGLLPSPRGGRSPHTEETNEESNLRTNLRADDAALTPSGEDILSGETHLHR